MNSGSNTKSPVVFVLSVDTEEEWDWSTGFSKEGYSVRNTQKIPKFHSFCHDLGIRPTYFIDYAIVADAASVQRFKGPFEKGECEIGAHLHPWVTPPVEEEIHREHTHAINLPPDLVRRKIAVLTAKLRNEFGARPLSFRSGRWGMNGDLLRLLAEEGYQIESSVHPFYADSSFSYYDAPDTPYWPDFKNCLRPGTQRDIFEIPVTSGFNRRNFRLCHSIHQRLSQAPWTTLHVIGALWHFHLLRKIPCSPELADAANLIALARACVHRGHRIIHMFLHSSSLLPGGSPYVQHEEGERELYRRITDVVEYLRIQSDIRFCTLTEEKQYYLQEEHE